MRAPPERPIGEPKPTTSAPPVLRPGELLRNRTFLLFQARGTLSNVSYTVYLGTILWVTYLLSGGIFLSGIVIGVQTVVFTLTFLISPLVDRLYNKRWVFILCYPLQTALALVLALTYAGGVLTVPILFVIVVLLAVLWDSRKRPTKRRPACCSGRTTSSWSQAWEAPSAGGGTTPSTFPGGGASPPSALSGGPPPPRGAFGGGGFWALPSPLPPPPPPPRPRGSWLPGG